MEKADYGKKTFTCIHMGVVYMKLSHIQKLSVIESFMSIGQGKKIPSFIFNKFNKLYVDVWEECK